MQKTSIQWTDEHSVLHKDQSLDRLQSRINSLHVEPIPDVAASLAAVAANARWDDVVRQRLSAGDYGLYVVEHFCRTIAICAKTIKYFKDICLGGWMKTVNPAFSVPDSVLDNESVFWVSLVSFSPLLVSAYLANPTGLPFSAPRTPELANGAATADLSSRRPVSFPGSSAFHTSRCFSIIPRNVNSEFGYWLPCSAFHAMLKTAIDATLVVFNGAADFNSSRFLSSEQ